MHLKTLILVIVSLLVAACATQDSFVAPSASGKEIKSIRVESHGGKSADVDNYLQRALLRNGFDVVAGDKPQKEDAVLRFVDDWGWDMLMYLRSIDINIYDGTTGALIATARWRNSTLHGFYGTDATIQGLVDELSKKLRAGHRS